jgi:hypothetical protein
MEALLDSEASKNESTKLPKSLAWIERGSAFIRRMNSERIAEDPHLKRLFGISTSTCNANLNNAINEPQVLFAPPTEETHQIEEEKPLVLLAAEQETAIVTEEEEYENKPTAKEIADSTYKLVMWTYKLHASLQSSLQYALFAKASEDGLFIPLSPRVYCVAPAQINVFQRLFTANTTVNSRSWNTASKRLHHLDDVIARQFQGGACVFDCGLFDGINRLYQKPLVYDEFCGKYYQLFDTLCILYKDHHLLYSFMN